MSQRSNAETVEAIQHEVAKVLGATTRSWWKLNNAGAGTLETWSVVWERRDGWMSPAGCHIAVVNEDGSITLAHGHYCPDLVSAISEDRKRIDNSWPL